MLNCSVNFVLWLTLGRWFCTAGVNAESHGGKGNSSQMLSKHMPRNHTFHHTSNSPWIVCGLRVFIVMLIWCSAPQSAEGKLDWD